MKYINEVLQGDCVLVMSDILSDSIASCITDPPYNYEFIGRKWNNEEIKRRLKRGEG